MDNSASGTPEPEPGSSSRRRSGRVVKAPAKFSPDTAGQGSAPKRKRGDNDEDGLDRPDSATDEQSSDEEVNSSDEEHPVPRSRKPSQKSRPTKPSIKKPRTNGARPATQTNVAALPSRPKKSVRIDPGEKGNGLFVDIFGSGDASADVAQHWLEKYRASDAEALADLINCVLQCAGCDQEVTVDDIRDPENIPSRLVDLQSIYQEQNITEYPLISRAKSTKSFRELLVSFFQALMGLLHETDVLYNDVDLTENIHAWLASMSSSTLRPFRHTATTIALAVQTGLVDIAGTLDIRISNTEHQLQAAKKNKNKSKAVEVQRNLEAANSHRKMCSETIQSYYDTIFVHRYRDVDPKIRVECVEALGNWIWNLPKVFMEPNYLRYLGWMLSDTNAITRQEVLKQLSRIFKRDAPQLGHFVDRFRSRLIEMAALDSEVSVRVAAISVIDTLRDSALLEPNEIDAIGKLIFDNEIRIRKAVVNFFISCITDVYEGKVEEMGGNDILEELDNVDDDAYSSPRKEWTNIKCLAETLAIYDAQLEENHEQIAPTSDMESLEGAAQDTRISLATQVLCEKIPEIRKWEILAGYLMFDHTTSAKSKSKSKGKADSAEAAFKRAVAPSPAEELLLLDVLNSAVRTFIAQTSELDKTRKRGQRSEAMDALEDVALQLITMIPQLLNKFSADPGTAAVVLRLEHCLHFSVFDQFRRDVSKYEKLLDEITTQFNRHDDRKVIFEASLSLLHARQSEELEELVDSRVSVLWENVINVLRNLDKSGELSVRGNLAEAPLKELSSVLVKASKLASLSDCVDVMELEGRSADSSSSTIQILSNIVHRGKYEPLEDEIDDLEDEIVMLAIKACQFYFMWKTRAIAKMLSSGAGVSDSEMDTLTVLRQLYRRHLIETLSSRAVVDPTRLYATGSLCDFHITFATLRSSIQQFNFSRPATETSSEQSLKSLVQEIEPGIVPELISIFDGIERQYAKRAKKDKALIEPADDEDSLDDEDEDDEDEEDPNVTPEQRFAAELKAEKALCELTAKYVLAIAAKLLDRRGSHAGKLRRRLLRNQMKLGNNYKEIVSYLDEDNSARKSKKPVPKISATRSQQGDHLSEEIVINDEDDEDNIFEDDEQPEEGSREDLRRKELVEDDIIEDDLEDDVDNNEKGERQKATDDDDDDDDD